MSPRFVLFVVLFVLLLALIGNLYGPNPTVSASKNRSNQSNPIVLTFHPM